MAKRHILPPLPLGPGELGWDPPSPIMETLRELVYRGHAPDLRTAAEGLMIIALPSVNARLLAEATEPQPASPATVEPPPVAPAPELSKNVYEQKPPHMPTSETCDDLPKIGQGAPPRHYPRARPVLVPVASRKRHNPLKPPPYAPVLPGVDDLRELVRIEGHAPPVGTTPKPPAEAPPPRPGEGPGRLEPEKTARSGFETPAKNARIRAQEALGGVFGAARDAWEGSLPQNVLERLLRMRLHPQWPTHIAGRAWLKAPVDKSALTGWCAGNFLWRGLTEHSARSLAGVFQVSYNRNSVSCVFVSCDGQVYPEIVYRAWLWCPADSTGILVGW